MSERLCQWRFQPLAGPCARFPRAWVDDVEHGGARTERAERAERALISVPSDWDLASCVDPGCGDDAEARTARSPMASPPCAPCFDPRMKEGCDVSRVHTDPVAPASCLELAQSHHAVWSPPLVTFPPMGAAASTISPPAAKDALSVHLIGHGSPPPAEDFLVFFLGLAPAYFQVQSTSQHPTINALGHGRTMII